jgi:hypothetical protein
MECKKVCFKYEGSQSSLRDMFLASKPRNGRFFETRERMKMSTMNPSRMQCKYEDYTRMNMQSAAILSMNESVTN